MFFFTNGTALENIGTLDFLITKNRRQVLGVCSVPFSNCKTACTRSISRIVHLKKLDHLTVTSSRSNIPFKMSANKSHFGVFLLKGDEKKDN